MINRLIFHVDKMIKTKIALSVTALTSVVIFILGLKGFFNLSVVIIPTFIMLMMSGSIFSTYVAECLTLFPTMAALANGMLFSIVWAVFSLATFIATLLNTSVLFPLALTCLLISVVCLVLHFGMLLPLEKRQA